jgi:hypothetical protein
MPPADPRIVRWTDHALVKADLLGYTRTDVEAAVLDEHSARMANTGAADWLVESGRLAVVYNHPTARMIWPHSLSPYGDAPSIH